MKIVNELSKKYKVQAEGNPIQKLAKDALEVQNASNLMGVSKSFAKAVEDLYHTLDSGMTEAFHHPILTLWLDKMCDMNGRQEVEKVWDEVKKMSEGK